MTPDACVARIQRDLGFRDDLEDQIILELNQGRIDCEDNRALGEPWFLRHLVELTTTNGSQLITLPSNFIRFDEDSPPWYYDASNTDDPWTELEINGVGYLRENVLGSGTPLALAHVGDSLLAFPTPDAEYLIKFYAFLRDDPIVAGGAETQWLKYASNMLCGIAGLIIAGSLRDQAALALFAKMRDEGKIQLMRQITDHETAGQRLEMGGPD